MKCKKEIQPINVGLFIFLHLTMDRDILISIEFYEIIKLVCEVKPWILMPYPETIDGYNILVQGSEKS